MTDDDALIEAALRVRENAYAPYSLFAVGAALRAEDGRVFVGANVENAAYPEGICAEAAALGALIAGGARRVVAAAVASEGDEPCPPCGGCRQKLAEFAAADMPVLLATPAGVRRILSLGDLFPRSFGAAHLATPKT
jgi:cytidine deaminase